MTDIFNIFGNRNEKGEILEEPEDVKKARLAELEKQAKKKTKKKVKKKKFSPFSKEAIAERARAEKLRDRAKLGKKMKL